jgi:hypothetical protein
MRILNKKPVEYEWTQTLSDLDIYLHLDANVTAKRIRVEIHEDRIKAVYDREIVLEGMSTHKIKLEDSTWFLGIPECPFFRQNLPCDSLGKGK